MMLVGQCFHFLIPHQILQYILTKRRNSMSSIPTLNSTNRIYPPANRPPSQPFHTDYTIYNSYRYPIPSQSPGLNLSRNPVDSRASSRQKQVLQRSLNSNLARVRSVGSFGKPSQHNQVNGQYTVIHELPDLQYSQSRFQTEKSTNRHNHLIPKTTQQQTNKSRSKSKRSESKAQLQEQLDNLKQQTIYKNKQAIPTGHEKQQAYFGLFAAKSKFHQMKKSQIVRNQAGSEIENREQTKESLVEQIGNMRKQYNRLRNYMEDLQESSKRMRQENMQMTISNNRLKQELKVYHNKSKICESCQISGDKRTRKDQSGLFNKRQVSYSESSPKKTGGQGKIKSSNSIQSDASMFELLSKAKQEIVARDHIISNLQSQLGQIATKNSKSPINKLNPISPFDIQTHPSTHPDTNTYNNIQRIKQYIETMNNQYNKLITKIDFLSNQLNQITAKVHQYMLKYQQQQQVLLEKQVQIDVHIKYTRQVMAKLGFWDKLTLPEQDSSYAETINQQQLWTTTYDLRNNFDNVRQAQAHYQWYPRTAETTNFNFTEPRLHQTFALLGGKI